MTALRVGLDIGATKTLGVVVAGEHEIRAEAREPTLPGAAGIVAAAARVVDRLRADVPEALDATVGVGIPGLVDVRRGSVKHAVNLGLDGDWFDLRGALADRLGVATALENDVNAATLGAVALVGDDDLAYLSIGTGLAAGLVLDGRLRRGAHGAAGEVGHIPVDPGGVACTCGQRGCLETIASGAALAVAWPSGERPAAQALFDDADGGDPGAVAVRDRFAGGIAAAVRVLALTTDVHTVVLGGGVAQLGERLVDVVGAVLRHQARDSDFLGSLDLAGRIRVLPADLPVAAVGAARLAPLD